MMTNQKILYAGCSFTAEAPDSGFKLENQIKFHWTRKIAALYNKSFDNIAIGGMSNREIYTRTIEKCLYQKYDLVIIMWSSLARLWIYYNYNNIDGWTSLNPSGTYGLQSTSAEVQNFRKLYYSTFQNSYIELKHWLIDTISLAHFLKSIDQPFIFIKGVENYIYDFLSIAKKKNLYGLSSEMKTMLVTSNQSYAYTMEKINIINDLIKETNRFPWINLFEDAFSSFIIDFADDGIHPGPENNKKMIDMISKYIDDKNLL